MRFEQVILAVVLLIVGYWILADATGSRSAGFISEN